MSESIRIVECASIDDLYRHYAAEDRHQPVYITLDLCAETLEASYDPEVGNARTKSVVYGFDRRWGIAPLPPHVANAAMAEVRPLAARICADWEKVWDGHVWTVTLGDDAEKAEVEIDKLLEPYRSSEGSEVLQEWLADSIIMGDEAEEHGITADTTDDRLEEVTEEILQRLTDSGEGKAVSPDLLDYFIELRDSMAEEDPLTDVEVRATREGLGLTGAHFAKLLRVNPRTLGSWEQGRDPAPGWMRPRVAELVASTDKAIAELVAENAAVLITYRNDDEYDAAGRPLGSTGGYQWPASWHRSVCWRAARITGARIEYPTRQGD